jgi:4-amino-4-deoxy-L-arabinose transferase-like glycosyltransferase
MKASAADRVPVRVGVRATAVRWAAPVALSAITALAAALRFAGFSQVPANPYYDAAVRSMGMSWHNFFYGAFDPSGQLSVDKIPVDLWLQVASVKLFGFSSVSLRLPEAIAATLAVPLLYAVVRRLFGTAAGLASAAALAVLPVSVLTARSDTMDSVMTALLVGAAWLVVAGAQRRRAPLVIAGGAVAGLAFEVKLFQSFIALPALALLALLLVDGSLRRRVLTLGGAAVAFVATALAWLIAWSLSPAAHRPFPIGSTNGSAWNVVFVYNGTARLHDPASPQLTATDPPRLLRLFSNSGHSYGMLIGAVVLAALVLGVFALAERALARPAPALGAGVAPSVALERRTRLAGAVWIGTWLITGVLLLSSLRRMELRYLETVAPAAAAAVGTSVAALAAGATRRRAAAFSLVAGCALVAVAGSAIAKAPGWAGALALGAVAVTAVVAIAGHDLSSVSGRRAAAAALTATALVAVLAVPLSQALRISGSSTTDATLPGPSRAVLSRFLTANQGSARYEVASTSLVAADSLIVRDGRPVLMLTTIYGFPVLTPHELAGFVRSGEVRYIVFQGGPCTPGRMAPQCAPVVRWAGDHVIDVSSAAGLPPRQVWQLTLAGGTTT